MRDYKKLAVWSKAHELVLMVYRLTREFSQEERYGLTSNHVACVEERNAGNIR